MHSIPEILDLAKSRLRITSDYALAKVLACTQSTLIRYRLHGGTPDEVVAMRLADAAGLPRVYVVSCAHAGRATEPDVRALWREVAALSVAPKAHTTRSASS